MPPFTHSSPYTPQTTSQSLHHTDGISFMPAHLCNIHYGTESNNIILISLLFKTLFIYNSAEFIKTYRSTPLHSICTPPTKKIIRSQSPELTYNECIDNTTKYTKLYPCPLLDQIGQTQLDTALNIQSC